MAGVWHAKLWTGTSAGLLIAIHLLTGLSLASWSMFIMVPFGKSPQLASIMSMTLSVVWCIIGMQFSGIKTSIAFVLILIFPPTFYPIAIRCITGFETNLVPTSATTPDPEYDLTLSSLLIAVAVRSFSTLF